MAYSNRTGGLRESGYNGQPAGHEHGFGKYRQLSPAEFEPWGAWLLPVGALLNSMSVILP